MNTYWNRKKVTSYLVIQRKWCASGSKQVTLHVFGDFIQNFNQIKDGTWLLQSDVSSYRAYFLSIMFFTFICPCAFISSYLLLPKAGPSTFLLPQFYSVQLQSSRWMCFHLSFLTRADVSHIPITLSPHVRKTRVCVVSAQFWEQSSWGSIGLVVGSAGAHC